MPRQRTKEFGMEHRKLHFQVPKPMVDKMIARCDQLGLEPWQYLLYCVAKDFEITGGDDEKRT